MIVIVEGVDGSGKSTLVKQLSNLGFSTKFIESDPYKEFSEWYTLHNEDDVIITDRSFITDLVYRICDGKPRRGMDLYHMSMILDTNVKIVFCESGTEFEDSVRRGEDNITEMSVSNNLSDLYKVVRQMLQIFTDADVFVYNWHSMNVSDVIKFIEKGGEN